MSSTIPSGPTPTPAAAPDAPSPPRKVVNKPGNGYHINWVPETDDSEYRGKPWPNALQNTGEDDTPLEMITLREIAMLGFMNAVTDKPEWRTKVLDATIIEKWRSEATSPNNGPSQLSEQMFTYCIAELQHLARTTPPSSPIHVFPGDVLKSDTAVSPSLKLRLQSAVRALLEEPVPAEQVDWHPGSNGQVRDLVHPSLFPLVYGVSRVLEPGADEVGVEDCIRRCGEGVRLKEPKELWGDSASFEVEDMYSGKFQWLPCEVDVSGEKARIVSYINNLHPKHHAELYPILEELIDASIPLWNLSLAPFSPDNTNADCVPRRIFYDSADVDDNGDFILPEPTEEFKPLQKPDEVNLREGRGSNERRGRLQVIVKLANIELTPEKPRYEGGTWHVEGKCNEAICATSIYYYDSHNITPSSLSFRQQSAPHCFDEISYEQDSHGWLPLVYGLNNDDHTLQVLGSVDTREGRLVTFPNLLQHQVQGFELADNTQRGWRKIVALFLVDPTREVVSTADVPCQRLDWWKEEVLNAISTSVTGDDCVSGVDEKEAFKDEKGLEKLPVELKDQVFEAVEEFPISLERAKELREALMDERRTFVLSHNEELMDSCRISLCEH